MTASQEQKTHSPRQILSLAYFWSLLRTPETLTIALLVLAVILSIAFIIPQQPNTVTSNNEFTLWVAGLPRFYQESVELFRVLGLFRIVDTVWFWLPVAGLVLICLVTLADYLPLVWTRLWPKWPDLITLQPHPFNRQRRQTIRVPSPSNTSESAASSTPLTHLRANLEKEGYHVHLTDDAAQLRAVYAPRRWIGPALVLLGLLFLALGLLIQALWGDRQTLNVIVGPASADVVANQPIHIKRFTPTLDEFKQIIGGELTLDLGQTDTLTWQLHHPYWVQGWWIIPGDIQITAQIVSQQNQGPNETIDLTFSDPMTPIEFSSPEQDLLFELRYLPDPNRPDYELNLIGVSESLPEPPQILRDGPDFSVLEFDLSGKISTNEVLLLQAYRLPGMGVIGGGLLMIAVGLVILTLPPPSIVWLQMITRGRGSRIEVAAELLKTMPPDENGLEQILVLPIWEESDD